MASEIKDDAFHKAMAAANCSPLWERYDATTNRPPTPGHIWRWSVMEPLIEQAIGALRGNGHAPVCAHRQLDDVHRPPEPPRAGLEV